jgi:hypothetical protein
MKKALSFSIQKNPTDTILYTTFFLISLFSAIFDYFLVFFQYLFGLNHSMAHIKHIILQSERISIFFSIKKVYNNNLNYVFSNQYSYFPQFFAFFDACS